MKKLTVGSFFSGIGGLDKGLEDTGGFEVRYQVENDPYASAVLKKHWPYVENLGDVTRIPCLKEQMQSLADSRAKTSRQQVEAPALPDCVRAFGNGFFVPFAWYDRNSQLWRTWQSSLIEGWERYSETWPRRGMTRTGIAYQLVSSERHIHAKGCSSWPTPTATDSKRRASLAVLQKMRTRRWNTQSPYYKFAAEYGAIAPPALWEWLMGLPIGHTELGAAETELFQKLAKGSAK